MSFTGKFKPEAIIVTNRKGETYPYNGETAVTIDRGEIPAVSYYELKVEVGEFVIAVFKDRWKGAILETTLPFFEDGLWDETRPNETQYILRIL